MLQKYIFHTNADRLDCCCAVNCFKH